MDQVILPIPLFGSINYYGFIAHANKDILLAQNELVDRKNKRNRYYTCNKDGTILNTIPITKPRDRQPLSEISIVNQENWQREQWRTLQSSYNKSPFFEYYDYKFEDLFNTTFNSLLEFNLQTVRIALKALKINKEIQLIDEVHTAINLPMANSFMNYNQVFSHVNDFHENLSILDLIFNLGPDSRSYLEALTFGSL